MSSIPSQKTVIKVLIACLVLLFIYAGVQLGFSTSDGLFKLYEPVPPGKYRVVEVYDGDTFTVRMAGRAQEVRLVGVDTPETHHPDRPVQCYGPKASDFVEDLIEGETVALEADPLQPTRDKYDRLLRYVVLEDGRELNEVLVKKGYAFATNFNTTKKTTLKQLQGQARNENIGMWGKCQITSSGGYLQTNPL